MGNMGTEIGAPYFHILVPCGVADHVSIGSYVRSRDNGDVLQAPILHDHQHPKHLPPVFLKQLRTRKYGNVVGSHRC